MEYVNFKNRKKELSLLNDLRSAKKAKLIILYGRRRIGKTELLREFSKNHESLYLLARQESTQDQLKRFSKQLSIYFNDKVLELNPLRSWDAFFTYLEQKITGFCIIFDEFPYLVQSNKSIPSILQDHWDNNFIKKNSFIILCGSSITMMESLLGYKSPLYGRRTEQIMLKPLGFYDASLFFPNLSPIEKVEFYAVLGGTPAYLLEFDESRDIWKNIRERILKKNSFLSQDVLFILREELNEPRLYFSIIQSIAKGNTKMGNIINDTGLGKGTVGKYLSVLTDLQMVERQVPITEKPTKSRKGIYVLKDNFFKFWFRFCFENLQYIEQELFDKLLNEKVKPEFPAFVGKAFENICLEWIKKTNQDYLFGKWWDKEEEIDIVGIEPSSSKALLIEVKWSDLSEKDVRRLFLDLDNKKQNFDREFSEINTMVVARTIEKKEKLLDEKLEVRDINDIIS